MIQSKAGDFILDGVAFFGRNFNEYMQMFNLKPEDIKGKTILDCPGGPASFNAEAHKLGIKVVGCDPLYDHNYKELAKRARTDIEECILRTEQTPDLFYSRQQRNEIDAFKNEKLKATDEFEKDFDAGFKEGRYVQASLPRLPFKDKSFDIAFSGYLLFLYSDKKFGGIIENSPFDLEFHIKAIRELLRLSREYVALYPVEMPGMGMHPFMDKVLAELAKDGVTSQFLPSKHRDIRGAEQFLKLTPKHA